MRTWPAEVSAMVFDALLMPCLHLLTIAWNTLALPCRKLCPPGRDPVGGVVCQFFTLTYIIAARTDSTTYSTPTFMNSSAFLLQSSMHLIHLCSLWNILPKVQAWEVETKIPVIYTLTLSSCLPPWWQVYTFCKGSQYWIDDYLLDYLSDKHGQIAYFCFLTFQILIFMGGLTNLVLHCSCGWEVFTLFGRIKSWSPLP